MASTSISLKTTGYSTDTLSCDNVITDVSTQSLYYDNANPITPNVTILYITFDTVHFQGGGLWYALDDGTKTYQINDNGVVINVVTCQTPTATPVPTAEPTATPVPTAEPTATPVPPTATPVLTAEPTATPVPPTATPVPPTPTPDLVAPIISITGQNPDQIEVSSTSTYNDLGATADGGETVTSTGTVTSATVGTYTITYSATDTAGNTGTATRTVNVVDTTIPVITLSGDNPLNINVNSTYAEPGYTATDNYDDSATLTGTVVVGGDTVDNTTVGQYNITYNVTDSNNNNAVEVIRVVNVNDTEAPIPVDATYDVPWNDFIDITLVANDNVDSSGDLTYTIETNPSKGNLSLFSGNTIRYTHTDTVYGSDSFTFKATDSENNVSNIGTITLNPENSAPVITGPSTVTLSQIEIASFSIGVFDSDGDAVNIVQITAVANGTISTTTTASGLDVTYTPNVGHTGGDQWIIKAEDSKGESSNTLTINFAIEAVPYFEMNAGEFGSDVSELCLADTPFTFYGKTLQANNVAGLAIGGGPLYQYNNFTAPRTWTGSGDNSFPVSDTSGKRILTIDTNGFITSIASCGDNVDSTSTNVKYATNAIAFCEGDIEETSIWYNGTAQQTLAQLVAAGIPLFIDKYSSDLYTLTEGATVQGVIDSGIYSEINENILYYKRSTVNDWGATGDVVDPYLWECEATVVNTVHELTSIYKSNLTDPSINEFCQATQSVVSLFYILPESVNPYNNLVSLAQSNTSVYISYNGALGEDPIDLFESNVFSTTSNTDVNAEYLIWENNGDGINLKWLGYDNNGLVAFGDQITVTGKCSSYEKPVLTSVSRSNIDETEFSNKSVFYAFYSCDPEIEGPELGNETETLFWPIYVIDGLHLDSSGDTGSYIKDFIDTLSFNNVIKTSDFGSCLEYAFKIVAEDLDDAISELNTTVYTEVLGPPVSIEITRKYELTSKQRTVVSSGTRIGLGSESTVNVYENSESSECVAGVTSNILNTYTFPIVPNYDTISARPNFNTQTNYKLDHVAKPLVRTNPKLSGNIKIVTDSNDTVYLESISANAELSSIKYKKYPINPNGFYSTDVAKFFKSTSTPSDLIYLTKRANSDLTILNSYDKQIEEEYQYGTTYNYSKNYTEGYRMFAPIWADNNMPSNFVIFRVKNPTGADANSTNPSNFDRIDDMLSNAEIIKTFDLSKSSNLGKYIRSHVQQETFPKSPITVSFDKGETTNYNGIDIKSGEITSKGEYIFKDFVETDKPLIEANDFITDGFRRNDMLCANLLNLEFLFDDADAADYEVNRYFGLYVDAIDSGNGEINSINNNIVKFSKVNSLVNPEDPNTAIPSHKQMSTTPTLGYVKINDIFYKISNSGLYDPTKLEVKIDTSSDVVEKSIGISHVGRSVNLTENNERGYDFVKMSIIDTPETGDKIAAIESREESYEFTFIKHTPGEIININIEDSTGTYLFSFSTASLFHGDTASTEQNMKVAFAALPIGLNSYLDLSVNPITKSFAITENKTNLGDLNMSISGALSSIIRIDQLQTNVEIQNATYVAIYNLPKGTYNGRFFSNQGTFGDVASALSAAINDDKDSSLESYNIGADLWVKSKVPGYRLLQHTVLVNKENVVDFINVGNLDLNNILKLRSGDDTVLSQWYAHYLNGGNSTGKSIFVDNTTLSEISIGDYLETRLDGVYNRVLDIVEDITVPNSINSKLILKLKSDLNEGENRVFNENVVDIGLFSAYNVYDMNFDFYDEANSKLKELEYEVRDNIQYEPYENALSEIDPITGEFNTILSANDIFNDDFALEPINYFSNLSGILSEESIDETLSENITSEFDRLKENQLKEFSTNSRIVPNINKWVLKDSLTVRDQPYYLNTNEAFGRTNFSPDISITGRSKDDMSHEWFYMDKKPKYLKYNELNDTFSYVNFIEDFDLTPDLFKSTKNNYFDKFMITEGFEKNLNQEDLADISDKFQEFTREYLNQDDINNTFFKTELKKKYTLIDGGSSDSFASTIFKGLKVTFKNRKEFVSKTALDFVGSSEFNGYKFSILLKTKTDVSSNDLDFEVIQNKKYKFVIFFITLDLSDYWVKDNMNRKLLYEMNHKIVYDQSREDYIYANTEFDGALDWSAIDTSGGAPFELNGISHFDGSQPNFLNQILLGANGLYGDVIMDLYPNTPGNTLYKFKIFGIESDNVLKIQSLPVSVSDPDDVLDIAYLPNYIQRKIKYYVSDGGANVHKNILEKLSINEVSNMVNLNDDSITYTTVQEDGTINNSRFTINFEDGSEIIKYATLSVEEDNDKPKSFKLFKGIIGYNLVRDNDASYYPFLIRHGGNYTVDFKPVITFTDMYTHFKSNRVQSTADVREIGFESEIYKHSLSNAYELQTAKSYYERYNRCGTTFNIGLIQDDGSHDRNWGIIKNHFYHKVNEINPQGVTKLSESSDKLPLYPLIDEIAISKKDVNVFRSSWDAGYYTRSFSGGKSEEIPGTLDNTEERSYFASSMMKVKNEYDVTSFTYENVKSQEDLDDILRNSINSAEVIFFEDKTQIVADFYITDATTRLLRNDGVLDRIKKYVSAEDSAGDKTTLIDDADFYINKNIIEKFVVDSISLYTKRFKGRSSSIIDVENSDNIGDGGFSPDNNFIFKSHKQKPMNFRLIYSKRLGYSYDIKPMIKIKS